MARLVPTPALVEAAGNKPKIIEEFFGRVNTADEGVSIARMISPTGWAEPGQTPQFSEYTVVIKGMLRIEHADGALEVRAGQAVLTEPSHGTFPSRPW